MPEGAEAGSLTSDNIQKSCPEMVRASYDVEGGLWLCHCT